MLDTKKLDELDEKYGHKVVDAYIQNADNKQNRVKVGDKYKIAGDDRANLEKYAHDLENAVESIKFSDLTERLKKIISH